MRYRLNVQIDIDHMKFYNPETSQWELDESYTILVGTDIESLIAVEKLKF